MYTVFVTVKVKPGSGAAFLEAAKRNREATRKEPGNLRFDLLRSAQPSSSPEDPEIFYILEIFRSSAEYREHQHTAHYLAFREEVSELMEEPRFGIHAVPIEADSWE